MTDLSTHHEPIGDLFQPLEAEDAWERHALTDEQLVFFRENGYLAGIQLLTDEQIEVLRDELSAFLDPDHEGHDLWYEYHTNESGNPDQVLFHALGAWRIRSGFHDVLWHPAFTVPASQLLAVVSGSRDRAVPVRFWHDQLFCKPARHGGVVAWHQDYSYWTRTQPMAHLTCWIGLDDATKANGCIHYVSGSHHWNLLPITGLANDMEAIEGVLSDEQKAQFDPVAVELERGQCSFHHPMIVHGSYENRTDQPRRAMVINAFQDGVRSATDDPLLEGVPPIPKGEKMSGPFFPLLFDPPPSNGAPSR